MVSSDELGDFDALVLGLVIMAHYKGQLVVPDFGFYGREAHASLVGEGRLIAGVNKLSELSPRPRQTVLSMNDRAGSSAVFEDAETLAPYAGLQPQDRRVQGFRDRHDELVHALMVNECADLYGSEQTKSGA